MNTTPAEGVELLKGVAALKGDVCSCVNFIVIPPFTHLSEIVKNAKGTGIAVGAQNCAAEAKGAYTGEVSAKMIASLGVEYVILGHSERREYYGETSATLNKKMVQAYENNLIPIYCVGEKLEERENGKYFDVVRAQIEEVVFNLTPEQFSKLIIAYEPVWAIGTGKTATAEQAQEIHAFIRKVLAENLKQQAHKEAKLIADAEALAAKLAGSKTIHLTSPHGTDLTYSAVGRRGNALYGVVESGQFSTIPTIEANVSPLEGSANGTIVANASIPYIGIGVLEEPVVCQVRDGKIISIEGGRQAQLLREDLEKKNDPNVYNIAEMGMGMNPHCYFCGFMLEDEGVEGSVHIGIGTSITLGGTVKAACHYDLIMTGATVEADGVVLLKDGVLNKETILA